MVPQKSSAWWRTMRTIIRAEDSGNLKASAIDLTLSLRVGESTSEYMEHMDSIVP